MTQAAINLRIDGRPVQAREGMSILETAKRERIPIPTLCHHEALESFGGCRLCLVEITHADWKGWSGLVTACLYPVEEGLQVVTENTAIKNARRTILDLFLARCPGSDVIRKMAAEYGITATSYRERETETLCILCGLCVRICAEKGCNAIGASGRGIDKEIASPFDQPPPDCIGCASCAQICPTGAIPCEDDGDLRKIWGHAFKMVKCDSCGRPIMPEPQLDFEARKSGLDPSYFRTCPACSQQKTLDTIRSAFDMKAAESAENTR